MQAFPSAHYSLTRWFVEHPEPERSASFRGIMLYLQNVYDFQAHLFRQILGCPVLKHYGHSERVLMTATMLDDERYFFWPQYVNFELLDNVDRPISRADFEGMRRRCLQYMAAYYNEDELLGPYFRVMKAAVALSSRRCGHQE